MRDREKEIKTITNRLEQLVLKAEKDKNDVLYNCGEDSLDYGKAQAYEAGAFAAFAIVRNILEGNYEQ